MLEFSLLIYTLSELRDLGKALLFVYSVFFHELMAHYYLSHSAKWSTERAIKIPPHPSDASAVGDGF